MTPQGSGATGPTPLARLRAWLSEAPFDAVVLSRPAGVAWLSRGAGSPIDRSSETEAIWFVVTATDVRLVTSNVETPRVRAEFDLAVIGDHEIVEVPWFAADFGERATAHLPVGTRIASDRDDLGAAVGQQLTALRLTLDEAEQAELIELGTLAASALEGALMAWTPGMTDFAVQADIVARLERDGIQTPVLIVGGDERVRRFRHPLAVGVPMNDVVMAVVVARRNGLHVAATRFASNGIPPAELIEAFAMVREIETAVLLRTATDRSYGDAVTALADGYARVGRGGDWEQHYQGGPIGYQQREFEIAPSDTTSPWYDEPVRVGQAVAWNPSLAGGAKVEDSYLVTASGLHRITESNDPRWPLDRVDEAGLPTGLATRPGIFIRMPTAERAAP